MSKKHKTNGDTKSGDMSPEITPETSGEAKALELPDFSNLNPEGWRQAGRNLNSEPVKTWLTTGKWLADGAHLFPRRTKKGLTQNDKHGHLKIDTKKLFAEAREVLRTLDERTMRDYREVYTLCTETIRVAGFRPFGYYKSVKNLVHEDQLLFINSPIEDRNIFNASVKNFVAAKKETEGETNSAALLANAVNDVKVENDERKKQRELNAGKKSLTLKLTEEHLRLLTYGATIANQKLDEYVYGSLVPVLSTLEKEYLASNEYKVFSFEQAEKNREARALAMKKAEQAKSALEKIGVHYEFKPADENVEDVA